MNEPGASFRCVHTGIVIMLRQRIEAMTRVVPQLRIKASKAGGPLSDAKRMGLLTQKKRKRALIGSLLVDEVHRS
jgi:hypothetical protein